MRAATAMLLALFALGAAGCGGDDSEPAKPAVKEPSTGTTDGSTATTTEATTESAGAEDPRVSDTLDISADDLPEGQWPFTVSEGTLRCEDTKTSRTVIFRSDGRDYPVNGVPQGGKIIGIEPIWKKAEDGPGTRMDITPIFKKGYELCD